MALSTEQLQALANNPQAAIAYLKQNKEAVREQMQLEEATAKIVGDFNQRIEAARRLEARGGR